MDAFAHYPRTPQEGLQSNAADPRGPLPCPPESDTPTL